MKTNQILYVITNEAIYPDSSYHDVLMVVDTIYKAKKIINNLYKKFIKEELNNYKFIFKDFILEDCINNPLPSITINDKLHLYYERWSVEPVYLNPKEYLNIPENKV